jgi:NADH-quinone oxidoreductase subunit M
MQMAVYPMYMSVAAIIYASFAAMAQKDMKKMIAYSSIAHMGYVTAGIFSLNQLGMSGAVFQMISHGLVSSALFFIVGSLYHKTGSLQIAAYGGVASKMPNLACFFMIATLGAVGLPGTSGFIGEFILLNGVFDKYPFIASISVFGMLLSAIYMLGLYKNVIFGAIVNAKINKISDLDLYEQIVLALLCALILLFGICPEIINQIINLPIKNLIQNFV